MILILQRRIDRFSLGDLKRDHLTVRATGNRRGDRIERGSEVEEAGTEHQHKAHPLSTVVKAAGFMNRDRIIVERLHGHWSAWYDGEPQIAFGGATPAEAVDRLADLSPSLTHSLTHSLTQHLGQTF